MREKAMLRASGDGGGRKQAAARALPCAAAGSPRIRSARVTNHKSRVTDNRSQITESRPQIAPFLIDICRLEIDVTRWKQTLGVRSNRHGKRGAAIGASQHNMPRLVLLCDLCVSAANPSFFGALLPLPPRSDQNRGKITGTSTTSRGSSPASPPVRYCANETCGCREFRERGMRRATPMMELPTRGVPAARGATAAAIHETRVCIQETDNDGRRTGHQRDRDRP
jgi:hypothetical protein